MKLVVVSLSRSGSTLMFYDLVSALPGDSLTIFEPTFDCTDLLTLAEHALVKTIIDQMHSPTKAILSNPAYKKIIILRDPRDRLISSLLFSLHGNVRDKLESQLSILQEKIENPSKFSFMDVAIKILELRGVEPILQYVKTCQANLIKAINTSENSILVKYEEYMESPVKSLFAPLALDYQQVTNSSIPDRHNYGLRRREAGDWRNWFTKKDIHLFKPLLQNFIERYAYDTDWTLSEHPMIKKEHTIEFVWRAHEKNQDLLSKNVTWSDTHPDN